MEEGTTYVGMDVHKRTIAVAVRYPGGGRDERTIPHETRAVNRLVRKLKREAPGAILCAYDKDSSARSSRRPGFPASRGIGSRRIGGTHACWRSCLKVGF
jgi:hypothetical protein